MSWFPFGPDGGDARAFAADPNDHTHLYLGTINGWIYESHSGGSKWMRLARVGNRDDLALDNIVVDPADPKHILVGAWVLDHQDGGLYVSSDAGKTWTSQTEMRGQSIRSLTESASNSKIMVAGTLVGVYRTQDNGLHWSLISPKDNKEIHEVESVAIDPADPQTIYAGTWHLPWKTTDGGTTWTPVKDGILEDSDVFSIVIDPKQPNVVYASACSGIYKSDNNGSHFERVQGKKGTAQRTRVLMQDPNHLATVFAGTTQGLFRTDDGGKYWMRTTSSDIIVNDVYVDPKDSRHVLLATDRGGVLASGDGGDSFSPSNDGFSSRQVTSYVADAKIPARAYVGVVNDKDWGGVFLSETGGLTWRQLSGGLNGRDVFSLGQAPDGTIVAGTGHGIFLLKGSEWERAVADAVRTDRPAAPAKGRTAVAKKVTPASHPAAAKTSGAASGFDGSVYAITRSGDAMYAATSQGILRSVSSGATWKRVTSLPADEWRQLAAVKSSVAAATIGGLMLSTDGGNGWDRIPLPPKVDQISAVALDGRGALWVAGREGVYVSTDKGANWRTPPGLYVRNVNSIFYDEANSRVLVTSNGPATVAFAVQMPSMQVTFWDTGWNLRFVRPMGDHLLGGTLFDGMVVQPRMVESADPSQHSAANTGGGD